MGVAHHSMSHVFCSQGVKHCTSGMLRWEKLTKGASSILFLEQTEVLGSPQTSRLSLCLLVSNPTPLQRALGYLGTWPSPFPVQSREVTKAQRALAAKLAAPSHCLGPPEQAEQCQLQEKMQFPQTSTVLLPCLGDSWAAQAQRCWSGGDRLCHCLCLRGQGR